jgi:hypothetical protein
VKTGRNLRAPQSRQSKTAAGSLPSRMGSAANKFQSGQAGSARETATRHKSIGAMDKFHQKC